MIALLLCAVVTAAELDENELGTVVVARPEEDERSVILDVTTSRPVPLPDYLDSYWLVHPGAMREAMARVVELEPYVELSSQHELTIERCEADRFQDRFMWDQDRQQLKRSLQDVERLKRQRWSMLGGGFLAGSALTTGLILYVALR